MPPGATPGEPLRDVSAPMLMMVGERDPRIMEANRQASREPVREPGALERVAELAADWFDEHLTAD